MSDKEYLPAELNENDYDAPIVYPQESKTDKFVRNANAAANLAAGLADVANASSGLLSQFSDWKKMDAEVKMFQEQAKLVTHKMDLDFVKDMTVLNRSMDEIDKTLDMDREVVMNGIQTGNAQLILAGLAAMNRTLDKSPVDDLNKMKQSSAKDDPLLDW